MSRFGRPIFMGDDDQEGADRQTASLAGMVVALFLVVVGLFLIHQLHTKALLEDCLLSGRGNCDVMLAGGR